MKDKQIWICIIWVVLLICFTTNVSATIDEIRFIAQQNVNLNLTEPCFNNGTYCSATAKCNITILDNNHNILINNQLMKNLVYIHTYDFNLTNTTGIYESTVMCSDTTQNGFDTFYFKITYNGKEEPSDFTKIFFIILFIALIGTLIYTFILGFVHLSRWDTDLMDVAKSMGIYFVILSISYFNMEYMGSYLINTFSSWLIDIGAFTHILIPIISFIMSYIKRRMEFKEEDEL